MNWQPLGPEDLIGQAARVATAQVTKARRLAAGDRPSASMKLLLYGPTGVGKTSVVEIRPRANWIAAGGEIFQQA
jgi:replication-associated recombination protein RarA